MFGIGMPELILIMAVALIVIGPKKLPDIAKSMGHAAREFRKATSEFKESLDINEDLKNVKKEFDNINAISDKTPPVGKDRSSGSHYPSGSDKDAVPGEAEMNRAVQTVKEVDDPIRLAPIPDLKINSKSPSA